MQPGATIWWQPAYGADHRCVIPRCPLPAGLAQPIPFYVTPYTFQMKYLVPLLLLLMATGCHSPEPPAAVQEAVAAHIRQHSAHPDSYQPLRWGPVRKWRKVDDDSMNILRARDHEDSLKVWWRRTYAERGKTLSEQYADSVNHLQDSLSRHAIALNTIASRYDTTRRGIEVAHTYQLRTAAGQLVRDSAQFLVPLQGGPVVRLPRLKPMF